MHRPSTIVSLADMLEAGYSLHGHCRQCGKSRRLDLAEIVRRVGREYVPAAHGDQLPLRCSCGTRGIAISVEPGRG